MLIWGSVYLGGCSGSTVGVTNHDEPVSQDADARRGLQSLTPQYVGYIKKALGSYH